MLNVSSISRDSTVRLSITNWCDRLMIPGWASFLGGLERSASPVDVLSRRNSSYLYHELFYPRFVLKGVFLSTNSTFFWFVCTVTIIATCSECAKSASVSTVFLEGIVFVLNYWVVTFFFFWVFLTSELEPVEEVIFQSTQYIMTSA